MTVSPARDDGRPDRLLVVAAHPVDADLAVAGAVSRWVRDGAEARLVCCTSGDAGSDDPGVDPLELAAVREAEQRSAAGLIGYQDVAFLHRPEGALVNDLALREQLVRIIRTFRPDVVAAPDPTVIFPAIGGVQHVDHREAGQAAVDAVAPAARNAMAFVNLFTSEGLEPHAVDRLYLYSSDLPDLEIDISEVIETKLAAVREHRSQLRDRARIAEIGSRETFRVIDLA